MDGDLVKKIKLKKNERKKENGEDPLLQELKEYGYLENKYENKGHSDENSIVYYLKNSRLDSNESNFIGLEKNIKDIAKLNIEMNRKLLSGKPFIYKIFVNSVDLFKSKVLGKELYSIEDIFDKQIRNISGMNSKLDSIICNSRKELNNLIDYRNKIIDELAYNAIKYKKLKNEEKINVNLFPKTEEKIKSTNKDEMDHYDFYKGYLNLKRKSRGILHNKNITNNNVQDRDKEDQILNDLEDMLTTGVEICEIISNKTSGILRYVRNTKKQWDTLLSEGKIVKSLDNSINILGNYSVNLHEKLSGGLNNMARIASKPNVMNSYYFNNHEGIKRIAKEIVEAQLYSSENADIQMDNYVNRHN